MKFSGNEDIVASSPELTFRFMKYVGFAGDGECWEWKGNVVKTGYGLFHIWKNNKRRSITAHRTSLRIFLGVPLGELYVLHSCDNRRCVNPHHLRTGTQADNLNDARSRGRFNQVMGSRVAASKLTEDQVRSIRSEYTGTPRQQTLLGARYGVHASVICRIVNGERWKHVS